MTQNIFKFSLGKLVVTNGILQLMGNEPHGLTDVIHRHHTGDWGDICREDKQSNNDALKHGGRLISSYILKDTKIWVITEADRSLTTVLLPEEY